MNIRMKKEKYLDNPEEVRKIADSFAKELKKELQGLMVSAVLFGSQAKARFAGGKKPLLQDKTLFSSDIDVLIVIDDMIHVMNPEVITAYRVVTEKVASNISKRLHITTMPITKFWDYANKGDPILINMLREGDVLLDKGMFGMAQNLLSAKLIKPTEETVNIYLSNGPLSLATAKHHMIEAVMLLHWSVMEAAHAVLLHQRIVPENPDQLVKMFENQLVKKGIADKKSLAVLAELQNLGKRILHGEHKEVDGAQIDRYKKLADEFYHKMNAILKER